MKLFGSTKKAARKAYYADEVKGQIEKAEEMKKEFLKLDYFSKSCM